MPTRPSTVVVTATALMPKATPTYELHKVLGIAVEIDDSCHKIVRVECTFQTNLMRDHLTNLLCGYDLTQGIEGAVDVVNRHLVISATGALVRALKTVYFKYVQHLKAIGRTDLPAIFLSELRRGKAEIV